MVRGIETVAALAITFYNIAPAHPLNLLVDSDVETVFRSSESTCAEGDVPDAPARAFRDFTGKVHLFATHFGANRALTGTSLDRVTRDCRVVFRSSNSREAKDFDNWTWLVSFYADGNTVHALGHNEFHGHVIGLCPKARRWACWYNTIVYAVSYNGGLTFEISSQGKLVAAAPYRFSSGALTRTGAFIPTNIIRVGQYYYALFVFSSADATGVCVMRTETIADPASWRAWDGTSFSVSFINPYEVVPGDPKKHTCAPLAGLLKNGIGSVVKHKQTGLFIAVQTRTNDKKGASGFWYSTSTDLVNWSESQLLLAAPTFKDFACPGDKVSYAYGSIIDPHSPSLNFEIVGDTPYLYMTRFNLVNCTISASRDLVRIRLKVRD